MRNTGHWVGEAGHGVRSVRAVRRFASENETKA